MATLVLGSRSFDMLTWNLADIAGGTVTASSASEVDVTGASASFTYTLTGSGFTTFDVHGFPTDGTVTGVTMDVPGRAPMVIAGISISATDFMGFVNGNDPTGLETAIFSGDDTFTDKSGNDVLYGYAGADTFDMHAGGNDTVNGGDGNDTISFAATFTAADSVDGGAGSDKLQLNGDYSAGVTFGASSMVNVETLVLGKTHNYNLTLNATSDTSGQSLEVTGGGLGAGNTMTVDASAVAGTLRLQGGEGDDTLTGGSGTNTFLGGDGDDTIFAGTGNNIVSDISGSNVITFTNWTAGDLIKGPSDGLRIDKVILDGDFSAGVTIAGAQVSPVLSLQFTAGHDYNVTLTGAVEVSNFIAGTLGAGDQLILNASAASAENGEFDIVAGAGNDILTLGAHTQATFDLSQGGNDTVTGGAGPDTFEFGSALTAADTIDGGGGVDRLTLSGGYTLTFGATTMTNISQIEIGNGETGTTPVHDSLTTNDANVGAGKTLQIEFGNNHAADSDTFDGSAETDGSFVLTFSSVPTDVLTGGAGNDTFNLENGGSFNTSDRFDGGGGNDTLAVDASGTTLTFNAHTMTSIETLQIDGTTVVVTNDANVPAGHTLDVTLDGGSFNGSRETDGTFDITGDGDGARAYGGAGDDTISLAVAGSGQLARFDGGGGADALIVTAGDGGRAAFLYSAVTDSTSTTYDTITHFTAASDTFGLWFAVAAVDASVTSGALSTASFDSDLAADIGAAQMGVHHAVVFTASSGSLAGDHFLIVDANGVAGYQAGQDLVIQLDSAPTLTTANFTS